MTDRTDNELGRFLRSRREQFVMRGAAPPTPGRRRTPGLRRTEVAARARISIEWYTRLEQGRGGTPSAQVLDAVCDALDLRPDEREHARRLAFGGAETAHPRLAGTDRQRLQRLLDNAEPWPAYVKSATWDVEVWNVTASRLLTDYAALEPHARNVLRILFTDPVVRERLGDWRREATLAVATFRRELARWNAGDAGAAALVDDLYATAPLFAEIWDRNEIGHLGDSVKDLYLPHAGPVRLRYEALGLDAYPGFGMVVYSPVDDVDAALLATETRRGASLGDGSDGDLGG